MQLQGHIRYPKRPTLRAFNSIRLHAMERCAGLFTIYRAVQSDAH